jgi:Flp pilus assembly protein TadG
MQAMTKPRNRGHERMFGTRVFGTRMFGTRVFGERGGAAVEAALVTPLVMALVFGIIEMGFVFKDYLAVAGAVRAGARIASASPRMTTFAQSAANKVAKTGGAINFNDVQQLWVYKVDPANPAADKPLGPGDFSNCTVCVKFNWDAGTKAFVMTSDTWAASSQNACSSSSIGGPPDRIGLYLQLRHDAMTGLVFDTLNISEASILSLEPMPVEGGCKPPP